MGLGSALVGAAVSKAAESIGKSYDLKSALKGKTPEQQSIVKYFLQPEGCMKKNISDTEYEQLVNTKYSSLNLKQKALDKTGVDESQVNEIPPVEFRGWNYNKNAYVKAGKDNRLRTTSIQSTWLLFSDKQIYIYQYTFDMLDEKKKERTEEYFYKDVTNFSSSSQTDTEEVIEKGQPVKKEIDHDVFSIVVPGDKFTCDLSDVDEAADRIQAMKAKLREKKS
ncbi:MAG: hypothetical protein LBM77_09535 [Spirochaetaceae bacterium]|jgi:hypothetical protein|nr:hypothetical protein [Spirochaetaceae bacterium]